jgi:CheY-like chemotaxis protein
VTLRGRGSGHRLEPDHDVLRRAQQVIAFAVEDTGIGISADKQQIIFEAFQQADGSTSRKYGGTGLGLAISRELSKLLGGEITEKPADVEELATVFADLAEAIEGRKKTVIELVPEAEAALRAVPELAGARILIVDDDIRNIYSLTSVLESYGVEVLHAERGADGIVILEQTPGIDIALIDIMMPEMDGYETMRQIRQRPALAMLPLISVTAKAMKGDRQKCLDAGASDYIAKPVDIDLLLALLRVWIARSREAKQASDLIVVEHG